MGGHRRDKSDSHMPLRQSEIQASFDAQELQVRVESPLASSSSDMTTAVHCNGIAGGHMLDSYDSTRRTILSARTARLFRLEILKTVIAFFCLMISAFLNFFLLTVVHDIVPKKPLDDLVFFIIDQQRWAWSVGDVLSTVNSIIGFIVVILHRQRLIVLRRIFLLAAILYGLRAIILGVTFLPPSIHNRDEICLPQVNRSAMYATEVATRFLTYVVTLGLTSGQDRILCGDLMFSGHTVVLTITYFVQLNYTPRGLVILRWIAAPLTFCGIAALVVSGGHYTMDVLVAYWLTSHVFWGYHQIFSMPRRERHNAPMTNLWWYWMCCWFEADVPDGEMPNDWSWPFSKPEFVHRTFGTLNEKLR